MNQIYYLMILALSPGLALLVHMIAARVFRFVGFSSPSLAVAICSIVAAFLIESVLTWYVFLKFIESSQELFCSIVYGLFVFGGLSFSYFILFTLTETARRIHILFQLCLHGEKTLAELSAGYGAQTMLSIRLQRMVALKQLRFWNDRYFVNAWPLYHAAKIVSLWSVLLGFSKGKV